VSADAVIAGYRRLLARLILDCVPSVSPSTFWLDNNSQPCKGADEETLATTGVAGLDEARQFAPLPKAVRERAPEIAATLRRNYDEYRREIAMPLAHWFRSSDVLLVLIDITMLLAGGVGMYNGQKRMLRQVVDYLAPGRSWMNRLTDAVTRTMSGGRFSANDVVGLASARRLRMAGVRRLAFVATKADKVHDNDYGKLLGLLHDLTRNLAVQGRHLGNLRVEEFACAAVKSTAKLDEYPYLEGYKDQASQNGVTGSGRFPTGKVPANWPERWEKKDELFPTFDVLPRMPDKYDLAPRQYGLNRVFDFVLENS
jgi:predicted YcjX-like family ATPase